MQLVHVQARLCVFPILIWKRSARCCVLPDTRARRVRQRRFLGLSLSARSDQSQSAQQDGGLCPAV